MEKDYFAPQVQSVQPSTCGEDPCHSLQMGDTLLSNTNKAVQTSSATSASLQAVIWDSMS